MKDNSVSIAKAITINLDGLNPYSFFEYANYWMNMFLIAGTIVLLLFTKIAKL